MIFGLKKTEVKKPLQAFVELDAAVRKFVASIPDDMPLDAFLQNFPDYWGFDGRNMLLRMVAQARNLKEAHRQFGGVKFNARSGVETR